MTPSASIRPHPDSPSCILALGTSTDWCSVALTVGDGTRRELFNLSERAGQAQSRRLLPMAQALMRDAGVAMRDLTAVAFDAGPGAFTGLRIGCGVAQGLGFALGIPLVPVGSLETLAVQATASEVFAAIDARMGEVYCGRFEVREGLAYPLTPVQVFEADPRRLLAHLHSIGHDAGASAVVAIGDAFARHPALDGAFRDAGIAIVDASFPDARILADVAISRLASGNCVSASEAAPVYVRDKVALDVDEQRRLREDRARATDRASSVGGV